LSRVGTFVVHVSRTYLLHNMLFHLLFLTKK